MHARTPSLAEETCSGTPEIFHQGCPFVVREAKFSNTILLLALATVVLSSVWTDYPNMAQASRDDGLPPSHQATFLTFTKSRVVCAEVLDDPTTTDRYLAPTEKAISRRKSRFIPP